MWICNDPPRIADKQGPGKRSTENGGEMMTGFTAAFLAAKRRSSLSSSGDRTGRVDVSVPVVYASGTPIAFGSPCDWAVGVAVGALAVANELSSHALTSLLASEAAREPPGSCLIVSTVSMLHSPLPLCPRSLRPSLPRRHPLFPSLVARMTFRVDIRMSAGALLC